MKGGLAIAMSSTQPKKWAYHNPQGDPCTKPDESMQPCGLPAERHRVEHKPDGDPCKRCGLGLSRHYRAKPRKDSDYVYYAGIDGEGQGRDDHRYVMLSWSNATGTCKGSIEAEEGQRLTTEQCLDFILSIPNNARLFAYAFNYDITKMLTDVDDAALYRLFRPELRQRKKGYEKFGPKPVKWRGYLLNAQGTMFSVRKGGRLKVIWDVFRFFQSKFTAALTDWFERDSQWAEMGPVVERMRLMKDKRHEFDKLTRAEIQAYCYDECAYMARLAKKLTEAHEAAGLHLRKYFGAGSTATAVLNGMGIKEQHRETPLAMKTAVASAFFGGRFENRVIGAVKGPVWGYDISSAYPYQLTFLPCLKCGKWGYTKHQSHLDNCRTALVRYTFGQPSTEWLALPGRQSWGPLPFRLKTGAIAFPSTSGGGWVWLEEFKQAQRLFPHVRFEEAFIYQCDCSHRPFADIPRLYLERLRIGKEGPGIVLKLGVNACYGKLAQSLGTNPPFQCWIWAGMITSGTRAQILEMLGLHDHWDSMLMVATDGIYSLEKIEPPKPRYTGTGPDDGAIDDTGKPTNKPLGGWERKVVDAGMFAARPGIYFPLEPTEADIKAVRARGVGRAVMLNSWRLMVDAWKAGKDGVRLPKVSRFHGAKSSISRSKLSDGSYDYKRGPMLDDDGQPVIDPRTGDPRERFGQWTDRPVDLSFNPLPKRERILPDGSLQVRAFPSSLTSKPYDKVKTLLRNEDGSLTDAGSLAIESLIALEQPDGEDYADYEDGESDGGT